MRPPREPPGALELFGESGMKGQRLSAVRHQRTVASARHLLTDQKESPAELDQRTPDPTLLACGQRFTIDIGPVARSLVPDGDPLGRQAKQDMVCRRVGIIDG